jgi:peptide/nickel transport system permease protein
MGIAVGVAIPLGVLSATRRGTWIDKLASSIGVFGVATPNFWLAIVGIYIFSVWLDLLPPGRMGGPSHYILPAITLGTFSIAGMMRLIRSSMLEVLDTEYVKLARIKGLPEWKVFWKHSLRNALIPVLTLFGVFLGGFVTGAIVTETVFAWPGIGRLTIDAVSQRDFPLLQAVILLDAVIILVVNLVVDILYAYINPRIRFD